jgi:hypothetical protein
MTAKRISKTEKEGKVQQKGPKEPNTGEKATMAYFLSAFTSVHARSS